MGKILFIRGGAVGDFIVTMPAIQLVRQSLPDNQIDILGYESIASLAVAAGLADEVRSIEHASMAPFFAPGAKLDEQMCHYLKEFDVVISYLYDPDGFFADNLMRAEVDTLLVGPFRMDESEDPPRHAALQLAAPLEELALFLDDSYIEINYPRLGQRSDDSSRTIALHPGSGSPSKNWSFESWVELASEIATGMNNEVKFLVVSGEAEAERIDVLLKQMDQAGLNYRHLANLPLVELGAHLQGVDLFLGHDSGISHLAATTGISGQVLFGPTDSRIWAPAHPKFSVTQAPNGQLGALTVDAVWADVQHKIAGFTTPSCEPPQRPVRK